MNDDFESLEEIEEKEEIMQAASRRVEKSPIIKIIK